MTMLGKARKISFWLAARDDARADVFDYIQIAPKAAADQFANMALQKQPPCQRRRD